ncbi:MAG: prephenate dehydrogenase [Arthrobacter sp.]|uniref:prephenate dehydrogenase n=1 Tax=unclassified Arthrobacter TaxID=235627 RepID=UPI00264F8943|nr:prephenate dehydrogenase [Micrococcaceae bacterium]MDN5811573.1 prephenate dehydrogenase [Micrococcaceae bacterium]MDN5823236.1 prephenate dehydrogenase [Micrococcaceae bacterium]MDN5878312.1 prephenate dehydrogenase [Micrococcaceae bacterium]MDN5886432.1 prephenate dehydrogenase [Micrococcaceae bacterium]
MVAAHLPGPVLVIGTGLLGASVGLGLSRLGVQVSLADTSPTAARVAQDIGAGTLYEPGVSPEPLLVVVGAPPDVSAAVVSDALRAHPGATVVDIASVKTSILRALRADDRLTEADLSRYVGTHPMAGREKSGPAAARGELFTAMPWVVCAHPGSREASAVIAADLAIDLGATVHRMEAAEHDAAVALISHFPQIASSLLASRLLNAPAHTLALAGNGLRDTTRIAASDPRLWIQILSNNAPELVGILHGLREDLNRLISTLEDPEGPGALLDLAELMGEGNAGQARIPGKHGSPPQAFAVVTVIVDDRPGQIAQLLADVGDAGINLEDLRMEHSSGHQVGMVEISVLPGRSQELMEALTERSWKVVQ